MHTPSQHADSSALHAACYHTQCTVAAEQGYDYHTKAPAKYGVQATLCCTTLHTVFRTALLHMSQSFRSTHVMAVTMYRTP